MDGKEEDAPKAVISEADAKWPWRQYWRSVLHRCSDRASSLGYAEKGDLVVEHKLLAAGVASVGWHSAGHSGEASVYFTGIKDVYPSIIF
jgi:hypothetical protein